MVQLRFQKGINSQKVNIEIIQEIARSLFFTRKKKRVFQIIFWYAHPVFYSVPPRIKYIQDWPSVIFFKSCVPCGPDNPDGVHLYVFFPRKSGGLRKRRVYKSFQKAKTKRHCPTRWIRPWKTSRRFFKKNPPVHHRARALQSMRAPPAFQLSMMRSIQIAAEIFTAHLVHFSPLKLEKIEAFFF
jgi:hypothetical protein